MIEHILWEQAGPGEVEALAAQIRSSAEVRFVQVANEEDAVAAVLAAIGGACVVVEATAARAVVDRLFDDLRALGSVDHRIGPAPTSTLTEEQRRLVAELLSGASLGEAAARLHLSRRTADRRLAGAREALGASSTPELLRMWRNCAM